jgi:hypothetical protein
MTDVHVYREEPKYRASMRPATSSSTIIQKLETNTVAQAIINDPEALGFAEVLSDSIL